MNGRRARYWLASTSDQLVFCVCGFARYLENLIDLRFNPVPYFSHTKLVFIIDTAYLVL